MTEEGRQFETDPDKIDWAVAYQDEDHMIYLAGALSVFGAEIFKSARMIEGLSQLEAIHAHKKAGITAPQATMTALTPFLFHWLADEILIVTGFENTLKADLLNRGYVIHDIVKEGKGKILAKEQKLKPLPASRLADEQVTDEIFKKKFTTEEGVEEYYTTTITMTRMLQRSYTEVMHIPPPVVDILKKYNKRRNKLHFVTEMGAELGDVVLKDLRTLDDIVERIVGFHKEAQGR